MSIDIYVQTIKSKKKLGGIWELGKKLTKQITTNKKSELDSLSK